MIDHMKALDATTKRALFVVAGWITLWHIAAVLFWVFTGNVGGLIAVVVIDSIVLVFAGLFWVARRLFPTEAKQ